MMTSSPVCSSRPTVPSGILPAFVRSAHVRVLVLATAIATAGCATVSLTADALLREAAENEIATLDKYHAKEVVITGRVDVAGLKNFDETVYNETTLATKFGGSLSGRSKKVTEQRAFVSLKAANPETGAEGSVVCFFNASHRADAGGVHKGDVVSLRGTVDRVRGGEGPKLVMLNDCERTETPETAKSEQTAMPDATTKPADMAKPEEPGQ